LPKWGLLLLFKKKKKKIVKTKLMFV